MHRVLIFTPTYNNLLQRETVDSVNAIQFDGEWDHIIRDENPYPGRDMRNCVAQFVWGRQKAIDDGYDGLFLVEHDMIIPPDALQKLWETDADVVYGSYTLRHGMCAINLFQFVGDKNIGMSLSLYPRELIAGKKQGQMRVSGAGFGCLLIKRPVFESVPFRDTGNAPDLPFATDCVRNGILCIGRTDVECGHIDTDHGRTLWPFEKEAYGMLARVLGLQDVTIKDRGQTKIIKKDRYASLDLSVAMDLQRCGYVKITNEADEVVEEIEAGYNNMEMGTRMTAEAAPEVEESVAPKTRKRTKTRAS